MFFFSEGFNLLRVKNKIYWILNKIKNFCYCNWKKKWDFAIILILIYKHNIVSTVFGQKINIKYNWLAYIYLKNGCIYFVYNFQFAFKTHLMKNNGLLISINIILCRYVQSISIFVLNIK